MSIDTKQNIQKDIQQFTNGNLSENALNLFQTLGYPTKRQSSLDKPIYDFFKESYIDNNQSKLSEEKALVNEWKYVDLLFQISHEEITKQYSDFKKEVVTKEDGSKIAIESFLFFVIELKKDTYSRSALSNITREVNKLFPMSAMILFKYSSKLTLSIINRRLHKRDENKDVLEKVTLIKDINIERPHRAHIEILFDLSFEELKSKHKFINFVELQDAWQKTLDTKELNERFYEELFYWYLWAVKKVKFPQIRPKEDLIPDEAHQSESVIRLLTRLLFCWFMKEKQQLIPEILFDKEKIKEIFKNFSSEKNKSSVFYRAILQNLFFATLSVSIKNRKYIRESYQGKNKDYGNPYVFRYQSEFVDAKENLKLFKDIPFLNGGLFECLDEVSENDNEKEIRLDGFSTNEKKQAFVPDFLFWDEHKGIDLSEELDNPRKKNETVFGIIDILNSYKFTIEENTPLEEEVALDPELLGKVFESLLAYYNPETKSNARKQTGSFYTPREIVNYMVDESLLAYFSNAVIASPDFIGTKQSNIEQRLRELISYNETENPFTEKETVAVIQALENLKVFDPACGSGAFPMGILHKIVWILRKVDPENKKWFETIINHLPTYTQSEMRKKLENENWDYLRKLGVIQQSIYGVDIQPIAIQIAKLRFFISLLVDQDIKGNAQNNFGLLPLPNLDFKLVSANTLIGVPEQNQHTEGQLLIVQDEFFNKFNTLTGQYFGTYEPTEKKKLIKKIEKLVNGKVQGKLDKIKRLSTHDEERLSKYIAKINKAVIEQNENDAELWESYKNLFKHESVGFFDIKYFFPEVKDGFDVVIGNPPYLESRHPSFKDELKNQYQKHCKLRWSDDSMFIPKGSDLLVYFFEVGISFINTNGIIVYITQNAWLDTDYGKKVQTFLLKHTYVSKIIDSEYRYFPSGKGPNINTVITVFNGKIPVDRKPIRFILLRENISEIPDILNIDQNRFNIDMVKTSYFAYSDKILNQYKWGILHNSNDFILKLLKILEDKAQILSDIDNGSFSYGQGLNLSKSYFVDEHTLAQLSIDKTKVFPIFTSDDEPSYQIELTKYFLVNKSKIDKATIKNLKSYGFDVFDPNNTRKKPPILIMPRGINKHYCSLNKINAFSSSCVDVYCNRLILNRMIVNNLWCFFNSTVFWLLREISGRKNLGGGLLKSEATDLDSFPVYMNLNISKDILLQKVLSEKVDKADNEIDKQSHKIIDKIIFDYIELEMWERKECIDQFKHLINVRTNRVST